LASFASDAHSACSRFTKRATCSELATPRPCVRALSTSALTATSYTVLPLLLGDGGLLLLVTVIFCSSEESVDLMAGSCPVASSDVLPESFLCDA